MEEELGCATCATNEAEIFWGIGEHSFKHQELVHIVTEVKKGKTLGILKARSKRYALT